MSEHLLSDTDQDHLNSARTVEYVSVYIADQLFGLPILRVQDVFMPERVTPVPLSHGTIAGVLNLRGRIVTAINMQCCLGINTQNAEKRICMAVGVEFRNESYGLIIDSVGEVLQLSADDMEQNPINLDARWASYSSGVYKLNGQLMVVLDVDRLLSHQLELKAA